MTRARRTTGDLPVGQLRCRAISHAWEPEMITGETYERRRVKVWRLRCASCGTLAVDVFDLAGRRVVPRAYEHDDAWVQMKLVDFGGSRGAFKAAARVEYAERSEQHKRLKVVR